MSRTNKKNKKYKELKRKHGLFSFGSVPTKVHKSKKDYNRKKEKEKIQKEIEGE